jgi:4-oxalocrotonate tautomerase
MPMTQVFMKTGKSIDYRTSLLDNIYGAMRETFDVPEGDRFMVVSQQSDGDFSFGSNYLGLDRSDDLIIIQITCNNTRTVEQKKALYRRIVERLSEQLTIRTEDIFINLVEVPKEKWSFGRGIAQYA